MQTEHGRFVNNVLCMEMVVEGEPENQFSVQFSYAVLLETEIHLCMPKLIIIHILYL